MTVVAQLTDGLVLSAPIYLDHNATTQPLPEVVEAVARAMAETWANPSSAHWLGGEARAVLEAARDGVCSLVGGALPEGVVLTSGGTEANNIVLLGGDPDPAWRCVITSQVEHASVLRPAEALSHRGRSIFVVSVSGDGTIDAEALRRATAAAPPGPLLVTLQWANSETGVVQPMAELVAAVREGRPDAMIHSDVAQAVGRVRLDLSAAGVDAVSFSGHKLHGPQGTGALVLADPEDGRVGPLVRGGGQERRLRSGTHNVAGAVGLGLAAATRALSLGAAIQRMRAARDAFEEELQSVRLDAAVNGVCSLRLSNTSSVRFPGRNGMELVARLNEMGVLCSQGSACSSGRPEPSHVLRAMGLSESEAFSSVRFSFSALNTVEEARRAARVVAQALERFA